MRGRKARPVNLSDSQSSILETLVKAHKSPQQLVRRAEMVLLAGLGKTNAAIGAKFGLDDQQPQRWRKRWVENQERLAAMEAGEATDGELKKMVVEILSDRYRSGCKGKFTAEQLTQIVALVCEDPEASGIPVSHWTPKEVAAEAQRREIVESISPRHVDRFLKGTRSTSSQKPRLAHVSG